MAKCESTEISVGTASRARLCLLRAGPAFQSTEQENIKMQFRQGDVLVESVDTMPTTGTAAKPIGKRIISNGTGRISRQAADAAKGARIVRIRTVCEWEIDEEVLGTTDPAMAVKKIAELVRDAVADDTMCDDYIAGPYAMEANPAMSKSCETCRADSRAEQRSLRREETESRCDAIRLNQDWLLEKERRQLAEKQLAKLEKQCEQMYAALKRITSYQTPQQLRRNADKEYGLDYEEALEMAYENVLAEAKAGLRGIRMTGAKKSEVKNA